MREIKFRAWDKQDGMMHGLAALHFSGSGVNSVKIFKRVSPSHSNRTPAEYMRSPRFTLMQYTALKDKNGKEIYEGDILHQFDYEDNPLQRYVVKDLFRFGWHHTEWGHQYEVIGNIYENPELLETKQ